MARLHPIQCFVTPRSISSGAHAPFRSVRSTEASPGTERRARRPATRSSVASSRGCSTCAASCRTFICRPQRRAFLHRKSGCLNVDASVTAVASANRRRGVARAVLEDILRLDPDKSVPGMLSRHGRTTLFTDDFWNVRHICTTADSNGRVSAAAACRSAGHWFDGDSPGGGACRQHRLAPHAAPRRSHGDGHDAPVVSIAVTAVRTSIDPNVEAGADITAHSGCRPRSLRRTRGPGERWSGPGCCKSIVSAL